ncbi:MAG: hypothetical protein ABI706_17275 [Ilumatobacteraceae bacterium]
MSIDETSQAPRGRSPSYPGAALETAVQRARTAYEKLRQHPAPIKSFTDLWGFKSSTTGPASLTVAALKKYGLLDYEGSGDARTARLTDLAVAILMKPDPMPGIQQAALTPPIYREMWDKYHNDVPPEEALRYEFVVQRGFTENGFRDFLRIYRDTISFAKLDIPQQAELPQEDEFLFEPDHEEPDPLRKTDKRQREERPSDSRATAYTVPVEPGLNVTVEGRFPLTPKAWTQFMAVLAAMRPALVEEESLDAVLE